MNEKRVKLTGGGDGRRRHSGSGVHAGGPALSQQRPVCDYTQKRGIHGDARMTAKLKAPFPYFGGKSRVAHLVWERLGDVDNYIEPFCGSAAVLLARPTPPRIETVNDRDCYVANFWRATGKDPEGVARYADWPVNEADLHARHRWLVLSGEAKLFRERMRQDPDYYDVRVAGWWCWGICCWIGGGWCSTPATADWDQVPIDHQKGVNAKGQDERKPNLGGLEGQQGRGVHAKGPFRGGGKGTHGQGVHQKRPRTHRENGSGEGGSLPGVPSTPGELSEQLPSLHGDSGAAGRGVHASGMTANGGRPQLADAYARGRGVHGNDAAGTCAQRLAWLVDWFSRLRDRLRTVRVCCGDWLRVCDSDSVTTRLGTCGLFLDPPYGAAAGRDMNLYGVDSGTVAGDVRAYCLERGPDPRLRLALCGYEGEGHEVLEAAGWECVPWKAQGGYGNRSEQGRANAGRERIWFSPHCLKTSMPLFGDDDGTL